MIVGIRLASMLFPAPGEPSTRRLLNKRPNAACRGKENQEKRQVNSAANEKLGKPKAYSYIRFSRPEQAEGNSLERQTLHSQKFAAEHGLELANLTYQDLGVSGFRGKNITHGELGKFLSAVETGNIPAGSWLLVEAPDRITRMGPAEYLPLLVQITKAGITIAFTATNRIVDLETLNKNPFVFYEELSRSILANQESSQKSDRLCVAWATKRRKAAEEKKPLTSRCPAWLELVEGQGYRVIEGRDKIVQRIFQMAAGGMGKRSIANAFNTEGITPWGDGIKSARKADRWHSSYITKILNNEATLGTYQPHRMADGSRVPDGEPIEGYFPAVITPAEWQAAHSRPTAPCGPRGGKNGTVACLFSGLVIDGYTGERMRYIDKGGTKGQGRWKYLVTDPLRLNGRKGQSWPYPHFENWMLKHLKGLDWHSLIDAGTDETLKALRSSEAEIQITAAKTEKAIDAILDGFAEGPESLREKAKTKAAKLAEQLDQNQARLAEIQKQIEAATAATNSMAEGVEEFRALIGAGDPASRQKLRMEIRRRVREIRLYRHGGLPTFEGSHAADIPWPSVEITYTTGGKQTLLTSRIGPAEHPCRRQPRDRKTGVFVATQRP